jgi:hypothetical protein
VTIRYEGYIIPTFANLCYNIPIGPYYFYTHHFVDTTNTIHGIRSNAPFHGWPISRHSLYSFESRTLFEYLVQLQWFLSGRYSIFVFHTPLKAQNFHTWFLHQNSLHLFQGYSDIKWDLCYRLQPIFSITSNQSAHTYLRITVHKIGVVLQHPKTSTCFSRTISTETSFSKHSPTWIAIVGSSTSKVHFLNLHCSYTRALRQRATKCIRYLAYGTTGSVLPLRFHSLLALHYIFWVQSSTLRHHDLSLGVITVIGIFSDWWMRFFC